MTALSELWKDQTSGFSLIQKAVVGVILTFIVLTAIIALILVYFELTK